MISVYTLNNNIITYTFYYFETGKMIFAGRGLFAITATALALSYFLRKFAKNATVIKQPINQH